MIKRVFHVAISVVDFDKMLTFYSEVLGLKVDRVVPHPRGGTNAFLSGAEGEVIQMVQYAQPAPISPDRRQRVHTGIHHLGLEVDDIQAAYRRLKEAGVELDGDLQPANASGHAAIHFWDPEGNRLHRTQVAGAP